MLDQPKLVDVRKRADAFSLAYCCQGCAEGTGCTCANVTAPGFSREGQKFTLAAERRGEQRNGAPASSGEISGERDNLGTEEAIDQSGVSAAFTKDK